VRLQDQELHSILLKDDINTWYMGSKTMDQVTPSAVSLSPCLQHPTPVLVLRSASPSQRRADDRVDKPQCNTGALSHPC